jgi:hypothetical protein
MFAHPKAQYFSIGMIDEEQLKDYAHRRQLTLKQIQSFLAKQY